MIGAKRIVALIPARGGSKGVPGKNVRALGGRPLIEYTIETAFAVEGIDRVAVTTDDKKIRDVAAKAGAVVIDRPPELATAEASTEVALLHALAALEVKGERFDYVAVLEPTTPFRTAAGVRGALEAIVAKGAESLLSVVESREVQGWVGGGFFRPLMPGEPRRRQDRRLASACLHLQMLPVWGLRLAR